MNRGTGKVLNPNGWEVVKCRVGSENREIYGTMIGLIECFNCYCATLYFWVGREPLLRIERILY